jgi:NADH:ubiquinone oxidoreductase subunit E
MEEKTMAKEKSAASATAINRILQNCSGDEEVCQNTGSLITILQKAQEIYGYLSWMQSIIFPSRRASNG